MCFKVQVVFCLYFKKIKGFQFWLLIDFFIWYIVFFVLMEDFKFVMGSVLVQSGLNVLVLV